MHSESESIKDSRRTSDQDKGGGEGRGVRSGPPRDQHPPPSTHSPNGSDLAAQIPLLGPDVDASAQVEWLIELGAKFRNEGHSVRERVYALALPAIEATTSLNPQLRLRHALGLLSPVVNGDKAGLTGERRIPILTEADLAELPEPTWLVEDVLGSDGLSQIYGKAKQGKTFVTLDLALCVQTGTPWHGHAVDQSDVLYILGEGQGSIRHRVEAWAAANEWSGPTGIRFVFVPLSILERDDLDKLLAACDDLPQSPGLIILDTLNRTMRGDENSTQDMTAYVAGLDRIRAETGAHVTVVHHTGWNNTDRERGSSVLRGAVNTALKVSKTGERITVSCDDQRDAEPFEPLSFALVGSLQSCALALSVPLSPRERILADVERFLAEHPDATTTEVRGNVQGKASMIGECVKEIREKGGNR